MKRWIKPIAIVLGFACFAVLIMFGAPLVSFGTAQPFAKLWVRLTIVGVVALIILTVWLIGFLRRRKAQAQMEEALTEAEDTGDGEVLKEKIKEAVSVLKSSGSGGTFLYDLPWYIIIGPPGAGKTTALLNSGIEFPLAKKGEGAMSGIGGTRYCDWWFAEEAVMIDTAGRYTTQDSDASADKSSWESFLQLLKRNRPKQPINGVILAFSMQDLIDADPQALKVHAETIRARLGEIHETLKIDFPVYVLFTKADLISGFREYFASFSASRRQKVWGATFQTSARSEETYAQVGDEYDMLVRRLSDESLHRLSEENDGVSRISIFGLPGQMAMLKDKVTDLLRMVFEPTRYKTNAILRGFYFTSGTQEGTPIDQVLGAMDRSFGGSGVSAGMSGKGKSFFLHDLMKTVIFAESGWVSYDARAVRRSRVLRIGGLATVALAAIALSAGWTYSYFANKELVSSAQAAISEYQAAAGNDLTAEAVSDTDVLRVSGPLQLLRDMPGGYATADDDDGSFLEGLGLGQRGRMQSAARAAYRDGLERMFRPRLVLHVEDQLQGFVDTENGIAAYQALKVYKILGGDPSAVGETDAIVLSWFDFDWREQSYPGFDNAAAREDLFNHLQAMLELDDDQQLQVALNPELIADAEAAAARVPVVDRAYSLIMEAAEFVDLPGFSVADQAGRDADRVFETLDGSDLSNLEVPPVYTYAGFHDYFLGEVAEVAERLEQDQWVLGPEAERARVDDQIARLGTQVLARYTDEWINAWGEVLDNLKLVSMAADKPEYTNLQIAASSTGSPILFLTQAIAAETQLTAEFTQEEASGGEGGGSGVQNRLQQRALGRTGGLKRIGLQIALDSAKNGQRAGAGATRPQLPGQQIEDEFRAYHELVEGGEGTRPVDGLLKNLSEVREFLYISARRDSGALTGGETTIGLLRSTLSRMPPMLNRMISDAIREFEGGITVENIQNLRQTIQSEVIDVCNSTISGRYPFANNPNRHVPISAFAELFGPQGVMDKFFSENLASLADTTGRQWTWRNDNPVADQLSEATLRQFQRAEVIREAFFPGGAAIPQVNLTVSLSSASSTIRRVDFEVNGQSVRLTNSSPGPAGLTWGGAQRGDSTTITINANRLQSGTSIRSEGAWALLQMIQRGSPNQVGDVMNVRYNVDRRAVGLELRFDSLVNPFNLRELFEFRCPQGL